MDKPVTTWNEFLDETRAHMWWKLRLEHRREGCEECRNGGCINGPRDGND